MRLLVTGGAGYIGSHFIASVLEKSLGSVVVVDDLSSGIISRIPETLPFYELDLAGDAAPEYLRKIMHDHEINAVAHFAALKDVGESVTAPEAYFRTNITGTLKLLEAMRAARVTSMLFSSSAAVYGEQENPVVTENSPCQPINPYGQSKLVSEWAMRNAARAWRLNAIALRYFNVAGAVSSRLADTTKTNLFPAIEHKLRQGDFLQVFGDDYPTPDGTCVRDYIHIADLVSAHIVALKGLLNQKISGFEAYNVGTGTGYSVKTVVEEFLRQSGKSIPIRVLPRRSGDPAAVTAQVSKIHRDLGWRSECSVADIVKSVLEFPPNMM